MHIKKCMINKIVAMLMCILLLSNFSLKTVLATSTGGETSRAGYLEFFDGVKGSPEVDIENGKMIATYDVADINDWWTKTIRFTPTETAVYTISLSSNSKELEYSLTWFNPDSLTYQSEWTRLAARYGDREYTLLTPNNDDSSTTIDVILEEGKKYTMQLSEDCEGEVKVTAEKRNISKLAMAGTNIPSYVVSLKADKIEDSWLLETYNDPKIKLVEFSKEEIEQYMDYGLEDEKEDDKGGFVEGICVNVIYALTTIFIWIAEWLINPNVPLTIDNIIFNRFDQTVIDLTPLGGINIGSSLTTEVKSIFSNTDVGQIIKVLFDGLRGLAIIVYIVMLLYIGLKILLSVGGKDQSKYLKYLEYWCAGILILTIFPYFIPAIPAMSNAIIALMEEKSHSMTNNYTTEEVLEKLGGDASLLGEDAEVVMLQELIDERIEYLNGQLNSTPQTREEAQANIDAKIDNALYSYWSSSYYQNEMRERIDNVKKIIDENYDNWTTETEEQYQEALDELREWMCTNSVKGNEIINSAAIPESVTNDYRYDSYIASILSYIKRNAVNWSYSDTQKLNQMISNLENIMKYNGCNATTINETRTAFLKVRREMMIYANSEEFQSIETLFSDYKDAVIQEEIEELEHMRNNIANDIMTELKTKAKEESRVVYAIAWAILVYQMFAILFMYYKRLFAIIFLIIIFPVIMAFYIFDKLGDGKAQSLSNWIKEFLANVLVQVLHAAIYIVIVNIGIDACNADSSNWFILVMSVCFLFPGERIVRGILGLNASTLGELKNNVGGLMMGAHVAVKFVGKGAGAVASGYRTAKHVKEVGIGTAAKEAKDKMKNKMNDAINRPKNEYQAEEERKKKKRSELEESKKRNRAYRESMRQEREAERKLQLARYDQDIRDGVATEKDKKKYERRTRDYGKAGRFVVTKGGDLVSKVRNGKTMARMSKIASAAKIASRYAGKGFKLAQKGIGLTAGALEGMENFSQDGPMSGLATARTTAKNIGGFQGGKKVNKAPKATNKNNTSQGGSSASGATASTRAAGGGGRTSASGRRGGAASSRRSSYTPTRPGQIRVNTNTQVNKTGSSGSGSGGGTAP